MDIKIILLIFAVSCGNNLEIKNNKLENLDTLNSNAATSYEKDGLLVKAKTSTLIFQGKSYVVSPYSSKNALDFINLMNQGQKIEIIFTGGTKGTEIIIETIRRK